MVHEGDTIEAGAVVARLTDSVEKSQLAQAEAQAAEAQARLEDAKLGGRDPEIRAAEELLAQAQATAREAEAELERVRPLFDSGVVARARLDEAESDARQANARVAELTERLTIAQLPARDNIIHALEADLQAAQAAVTGAREALAKRTVTAPEAGRIERLLREPGETAGPSAAIVRYLPQGAMMAIGFIPEELLGGFAIGDRLAVACDACAGDLTAVVTTIYQEAAFTSPIIFSDKERARLLFRVEARFEGEAPPSGTPLQLRQVP